jgi:hypothetical protein
MRNVWLAAVLIGVLSFVTNNVRAQSDAGAAPPAPSRSTSTPSGCPVEFFAQRRSSAVVRWTKSGEPIMHGQGVQLTFSRFTAANIVKAQVAVHGLSDKSRVMPVGSSTNDELTESFELAQREGQPALLSREIWTKAIGVVTHVEITEIGFDDGSSWHSSAKKPAKRRQSR